MFLESLLRVSIQGGAAIAALYLASRLFPAVSPKLRLWMWRLLFLKLVVGLVPLAPLSLKILPGEPTLPAPAPLALPQVNERSIKARIPGPSEFRQPTTSFQEGDRAPLAPWLAFYLLGVVAVGGRAVYLAVSFRTILRSARPVTDPALLSTLWDLSQAAGRNVAPVLLESADVSTAMVVGCKNSAILIPSLSEPCEDVSLTLAHEVAHLRHHDLEWNCFTSVVQTLFFFHPLVWLAARAHRLAQESAADLTAIRLSKTSPRRYAEMLVRATVVGPPSVKSVAAGMSVSGSMSSMQQRLKDMRYFNSKPTVATLTLATLLSSVSIAMVPTYSLERRAPVVPYEPSFVTESMAVQTKASATEPDHKSNQVHRKLNPKSKPAKASHVVHKPASVVVPKSIAAIRPVKAGASHELALDGIPAREGFRKLFQTYGKSFSMTSDVTGIVTLFAHDVTFEQALANLVGQVNATYKIEGGIYAISRMQAREPFGRGRRFANGNFLPGQRSEPAFQPGAFASGNSGLMDLEMSQADVREALRAVFKRADVSYTISPDVQGVVTVSLRNVTLDVALLNVTRQVDATFRIEGGVYQVVKRIPSGQAGINGAGKG